MINGKLGGKQNNWYSEFNETKQRSWDDVGEKLIEVLLIARMATTKGLHHWNHVGLILLIQS